MRTVYATLRLYAFLSVIVVSAVALGLAANLANQFLPHLRGVSICDICATIGFSSLL